MRLLGFPLEGCTRISPEPALLVLSKAEASKAEWAWMTMVGIGGARSSRA